MSRLLQVVIALVGLAITAVLGYASQRSENLQAKHALLALFSDSVSVARSTCDAAMTWVAQDALERLERLESERLVLTPNGRAERQKNLDSLRLYKDNLAEIQGTISTNCMTPKVSAPSPVAAAPAPTAPSREAAASVRPTAPVASSSAPAIVEQRTANIELRRAEIVQQSRAPSAAPAPEAAARGGDAEQAGPTYFVVLASYGVDDAASYDASLGVAAHFRQLAAATHGAGASLRLYRTRATNHFAIVLAPEDATSRDEARRLVATARGMGWAPDAFVQVNRDWVLCDNPNDPRACGR